MKAEPPTTRRTLHLAVPALAVAAVVAATALGLQAQESHERRSDQRQLANSFGPPPLGPKADSRTETFPSSGAAFTPVPKGTRARIDAAAARAAVAADGMRSDVQATIEPVVTLKKFTNTVLGQTGGPPFGSPKYLDVLVWDVEYPHSPVQRLGPADGPTTRDDDLPPCDLHVIVNATTSAVIEGFQDCPSHQQRRTRPAT